MVQSKSCFHESTIVNDVRQWMCLVCVYCVMQKQASGQMLLQKVYSHVDLLEVKYFGLQFTDNHNVHVS